uniref:Uncharacterized protein n=1 Tax=Tetranychus urticae TaxID=32264 RepID=T1KN29_TETUR
MSRKEKQHLTVLYGQGLCRANGANFQIRINRIEVQEQNPVVQALNPRVVLAGLPKSVGPISALKARVLSRMNGREVTPSVIACVAYPFDDLSTFWTTKEKSRKSSIIECVSNGLVAGTYGTALTLRNRLLGLVLSSSPLETQLVQPLLESELYMEASEIFMEFNVEQYFYSPCVWRIRMLAEIGYNTYQVDRYLRTRG